jgi:signal peptidase II
MKPKQIIVFIIFTSIVIDQSIKYLANTCVINTGIIFGLPIQSYILTILISFGAIVLLLLLLIKTKSNMLKYAIAGLLGGTCSNLVDRLFLGGVCDYICIKPFPIFNLADIVILISYIVILYSLVIEAKKR